MKSSYRNEVTDIFGALAAYVSRDAPEWHLQTSVTIGSAPITLFHRADGTIGMVIPATDYEYESFRPDHLSSAFSLTKLVKDNRKQIRLTLHDLQQKKVFGLLLDDILKILAADSSNAIQKTANLVHHWRELFARRQSTWLSPAAEIGLLCELEVLQTLLLDGHPLEAWRGPEGSTHDFEFAGQSIECKASTVTNGLRISIHGISQLQALPGKSLRLIVRKYEPGVGGPLSIPLMVEQILDIPGVSRSLFMEKLDLIGGNPLRLKEETEFGHYTPLESFEFDVESGFPRIEGIGAETRIQEVRYVLDLADPQSVPGYTSDHLFPGGE